MNVNDVWNKFITNGSPLSYIEYSKLKQQEVKDAQVHQSTCNKSDGCQGK